MEYILHMIGHKLENSMSIECADEEDLATHAKAAILDERIKKIVAKKNKL